MTKYEEELVSEYKIAWMSYCKAKNNYMFARQGLQPSYVKEPKEFLKRIKSCEGFRCALFEKRLRIYNIDPVEVRRGL